MRRRKYLFAVISALLLAGCTVHPPGEQQERQTALRAGAPFTRPIEQRQVLPLPANPTAEDLVHRALLASSELEQRYWEWRSAIEQIPQDGTQATNLAVFGSASVTRSRMSFDKTTLSLGNDPMADIVLPTKLSAAAQRALENARAAGLRFRKAQFELRGKVLSAYADYSLTAELIRLEQSNAQLLQSTVVAVDARNEAGAAGQQELLKSRNELDLSRNEISSMQAQLPAQRAALNALLDRTPDAPIPIPGRMPEARAVVQDDGQVLQLVAERNLELAALAQDVAAHKQSLALARLQYLPDFSISVGTDLAGIAQSLAGMVTVPLLRHQAIDAAVAQAEANLRATQAMRRQVRNDLGTQAVMDLSIIRDADRQLDLFQNTVLPRAEQVVTVGRAAYEAGRSSLLDLLDAQKSLIAIQRLVAHLRATREQRLDDLEAITGQVLDREHSPTSQR
ncbi:MAG TPA: TolC family protein [Tepidisphaeraceae bacterium]|nr:TolC family protein [Tepidisphaeraceae bacterium]